MNWAYVFWAWAGWCTGILTVMQLQVWTARRGKHYMEFDMKLLPSQQEDWDEAIAKELEVFIPTPRDLEAHPPVPAMQECPQCGRAFKRVKTHIAMSHKVVVDDD